MHCKSKFLLALLWPVGMTTDSRAQPILYRLDRRVSGDLLILAELAWSGLAVRTAMRTGVANRPRGLELFVTFFSYPIARYIHIHGCLTKMRRYLHGAKTELDERGFYSEAPGGVRALGMDYSTMDSSWGLMPSSVSGFPLYKSSRDSSFLHSNYPQLQPMQNLGQVTISSLPKHHQHSYRGNYGPPESAVKSEQPLRPFFDEWPRTRDSWSDLDDERSNRSSLNTTQLSMSIPMSSSDFSTTSSRSPNGAFGTAPHS
ncbi:Growth-regulating factor 5 [Platanthera guangdongensis]|uniref:Growth-regulating factor 5 n=1 Tax=Platanthera guangdongensis TaxID=2320717 RepID=A0ABR2MYE9_9ASPA